MQNASEYYGWIERAMGWLWGWGIGSVVIGAGLATRRSPRLRHAGLQTLGWGAIDAAIALNARVGARRKQNRPPAKQATLAEARRTRAIVAVNGLLDVGYVAGGLWLVRSAGRRPERNGMGIGIMLQGLFLLVYDAVLALALGRWTKQTIREATRRDETKAFSTLA